MTISDFRSKHAFLSNGYTCNILYENQIFPSVEHAFQAAKTDDLSLREEIRTAPDPNAAKALGRNLVISPDWDGKRLAVMENLLRQKFELNLDLKIKLLMTGDQDLIQGGMRGDTFWGKDKAGSGQNNLGQLMMKIRKEVRQAEGGAIDVLSTYLSGCGLGFIGDKLMRMIDKSYALTLGSGLSDEEDDELAEIIKELK